MDFREDQNGFALARKGQVTIIKLTSSTMTSSLDVNRLHNGISSAIEGKPVRLAMDLTDVSSAGSAFLGMLLSLAKQIRADGGRMAITASPIIQQLFQISKTGRMFQQTPSLDAAIWFVEQ